MKGIKRSVPLQAPPVFEIVISACGAFLGIAVVAILSMVYALPLLAASFGASAVLLYGVPDSPLSQPRNVFLGHVFSAIVGVAAFSLLGSTWWSASLAVALAIVVMQVTKTTHPPGGATALLAVLSQARPEFIITPIAAGAALLIIIALLVNNLSPTRSYPRYWI